MARKTLLLHIFIPKKNTYLKHPETAEDKKAAFIIHGKMSEKAQNGVLIQQYGRVVFG
jgi:hypothetical protein